MPEQGDQGLVGGAVAGTYCLAPSEVMAALQAAAVAGSWLVAAQRCRQQRLMRLQLFDEAMAAGRQRLQARRLVALAALTGKRGSAKRSRDAAEHQEQDDDAATAACKRLARSLSASLQQYLTVDISTSTATAAAAGTGTGDDAGAGVDADAAMLEGQSPSEGAGDALREAEASVPPPSLTPDLVHSLMLQAGLLPPPPAGDQGQVQGDDQKHAGGACDSMDDDVYIYSQGAAGSCMMMQAQAQPPRTRL